MIELALLFKGWVYPWWFWWSFFCVWRTDKN